MTDLSLLTRDRDERLDRLDATNAAWVTEHAEDRVGDTPVLIDPDVEAMITAPAGTVLGSTTILDAVNARKDAA